MLEAGGRMQRPDFKTPPKKQGEMVSAADVWKVMSNFFKKKKLLHTGEE